MNEWVKAANDLPGAAWVTICITVVTIGYLVEAWIKYRR